MKRIIFRLFLIAVFISVAIGLILFARGYRFDTKTRTVSSTGILAISSSPKAAKVYINGSLKGVTDLNITLAPGTYTVEIKKDGYSSYTKTLSLKGELVETVDPILFPINPSLAPLTNLGIVKAIQIDQSDKIVLFAQNTAENKDGIYLFDSTNRPISLFPPLKLLVLKSDIPAQVDLKDAIMYFSYDFKQAIIEFPLTKTSSVSYLISLDDELQKPFEVTLSKETLLTAWEQERQKETAKVLETFPKEIKKIATDSFKIISFSPDQTKVFYQAKGYTTLPLVLNPPLISANQTQEERTLQRNAFYTYDKREDKNFRIAGPDFNPETALWYTDSKRLILNEGKRIAISLYDGQGKQTVYSGPFEVGFFATNSAGKILILANLNPQSNKLPDLYEVGIR